MLKALVRGTIIATLFIIGDFVLDIWVPRPRGLAEVLLEPGYAVLRPWYGEVGDLLGLAILLFLNLIFYTVASTAVIWTWRRVRRP